MPTPAAGRAETRWAVIVSGASGGEKYAEQMKQWRSTLQASLVDREALAAAQVAELEPGDALFYPAMWWHQVNALEPFNVMVNYWWTTSPPHMDTPQNTLLHALLSLRDRPEPEKRAWRAMFDYYVFGPADRAGAHLPEAARGNLGPLDETKARRLRALLLQRLNR